MTDSTREERVAELRAKLWDAIRGYAAIEHAPSIVDCLSKLKLLHDYRGEANLDEIERDVEQLLRATVSKIVSIGYRDIPEA